MSKKKSCVWSRRTKALKTPKRGDLRKWVKNDKVKTCMFRTNLGEFNTFFSWVRQLACKQCGVRVVLGGSDFSEAIIFRGFFGLFGVTFGGEFLGRKTTSEVGMMF